jgi:hypothetical protein
VDFNWWFKFKKSWKGFNAGFEYRCADRAVEMKTIAWYEGYFVSDLNT